MEQQQHHDMDMDMPHGKHGHHDINMAEHTHHNMDHVSKDGLHWTTGGTLVFVCALLLSIISTAAVTLRFIARGYMLRVLGPSDWFLLMNLILSFGNTSWMGFHVAASLDQFHDKLESEGKQCYLIETYAVMVMSSVSLILNKISVLLLFLNFIVHGNLRKLTYGVLSVVVVYGLCQTATNIVLCLPLQSFWWDLDHPNRKCINAKAKWYVDAGMNIALDVIIFCIPIPAIRSMTIPRKQKMWLYVVFAVGFLICIVSIVRLYYLYISPFGQDSTYKGTNFALWSTLELNLAIVVACAPTLKPLIAKFYEGVPVSTGNNNIRGPGWVDMSSLGSRSASDEHALVSRLRERGGSVSDDEEEEDKESAELKDSKV